MSYLPECCWQTSLLSLLRWTMKSSTSSVFPEPLEWWTSFWEAVLEVEGDPTTGSFTVCCFSPRSARNLLTLTISVREGRTFLDTSLRSWAATFFDGLTGEDIKFEASVMWSMLLSVAALSADMDGSKTSPLVAHGPRNPGHPWPPRIASVKYLCRIFVI